MWYMWRYADTVSRSSSLPPSSSYTQAYSQKKKS
jgi:hypothetical protein